MLRQLRGSVAWVTGAGTGIGEAAARSLADEGMTLVLSGRRVEPLEAVAARVREAGGRAEVAPLDVADKEAVSELVAQIEARHGRLDLLVQSAGLNSERRNWHNVPLDEFETTIRVDLDGAFFTARAVLPLMKRQGDGLIVQVSSWAGRYVNPVVGPAYAAAKHALNALSESLNMEACTYGVRSCALCPGEVSTPILDKRPIPVSQEDRDRMLQPEDMGEIIRFLAKLPPHVCVNELLVSPTWNRAYVLGARAIERLE